jgi:hypothetical protein
MCKKIYNVHYNVKAGKQIAGNLFLNQENTRHTISENTTTEINTIKPTKKNVISQVGVLIVRFSLRKSYYAYDQHALNNQKN